MWLERLKTTFVRWFSRQPAYETEIVNMTTIYERRLGEYRQLAQEMQRAIAGLMQEIAKHNLTKYVDENGDRIEFEDRVYDCPECIKEIVTSPAWSAAARLAGWREPSLGISVSP